MPLSKMDHNADIHLRLHLLSDRILCLGVLLLLILLYKNVSSFFSLYADRAEAALCTSPALSDWFIL